MPTARSCAGRSRHAPISSAIAMEEFGPTDADALDYCTKASKECDLYVGIIGHRRGWEPKGDNKQRSITEMEYDTATEFGRPRFVSIAPDNFPVPNDLREPDELDARQKAYRARVGSERVAGVRNFDSPATLAAEFRTALLSHVISSDLIKEVRPDLFGTQLKEAQAPVTAALEKLAEDKDVDLLALAKNPQGADLAELEAKLIARAEQHTANAIDERRQAAEYWRHVGALAFLNDTEKALDAYRKATNLDPDDAGGWNELGHLLDRVGQLDEAVAAYGKVLAFGNNVSDEAIITAATVNLGSVFHTRGDLDKAEEMYRTSLTIEEALGRKEGMAVALSNLGVVFETRGDLNKAEEMYREALSLDEELNNQVGIASAYGNLGNMFQTRGDLDNAEEMYCKALSLNEMMGRKEGMAKQYGNLGVVFGTRGDLDKAEEMYRKALSLNEALGRKEGMANQYGNLGNVLKARGDLDTAEEMYRRSLAIDQALGRKEGIASDHANLGAMYEMRGDIEQACVCWRKSRDLYRALGSPNAQKVEQWMRNAGCEDSDGSD